jgi:hypothetical protein
LLKGYACIEPLDIPTYYLERSEFSWSDSFDLPGNDSHVKALLLLPMHLRCLTLLSAERDMKENANTKEILGLSWIH